VRSDRLVERDTQLQVLVELMAEPMQSGGVVLLSAEAGFGKTSLLDAFFETLDHRYRVLMAACEPLGIPAALGPLFDFVGELPPELQDDIRSGAGRMSVYRGLLDLVKNDRVVLVFEDIHWADEATLGLIRYLGRRIGATRSVLIVTFRSEEIALNPQLRLVAADLGSVATRIELPPLTLAGVEELTEGMGADPVRVYETTLGNPFFVEEVMSSPERGLPPSVSNAVLANAGLLTPEALEFLQMVALSPDGLSIANLDDANSAHVDLAFQRRLVTSAKGQVNCRHELIRQSLVQALPPALERRLHLQLLAGLEGREVDSPDITRLAYHSIGAGEPEKALNYSLRAAHAAAAAGAHRQAAFHLANALEFSGILDRPTLSKTLLEAAVEHNFINAFDTATSYARLRLGLAGDPVEEAGARAWVAFFESRRNDLDATRIEAASAAQVLRQHPASEELALALAALSWVELVEGNWKTAQLVGEEAIAVARATGSASIEVYAATTVGTARWELGERDGFDQVEEASRLGLATDTGEFAARALNNLGVISLERGRLEEARRWFNLLQEYATSNELDAWYIAAVSTMAWIEVACGRWDDADRALEIVSGQKTCFQTEIETLTVAARLRMRRGDPGALDLAESVFSRLEEFNDHDAHVSGGALAMEAAWVGIFPLTDAADRYRVLCASPGLENDRSSRALLAFWALRLGLEMPTGDDLGQLVDLEFDDRAAEASSVWAGRGFPVEAAITRAMVPDPDLDSVFADLARMGADGVATGLRRELQRRGVKHVPRGERASTQENPEGLTAREMEVLGLLATGSSNSSIAGELFISEKTAGHHVSSVLAKLHVSSRAQAAARAVANGWATPK
jgi:DNA-binding CsgD family transcriptional regulator/tetratricopeptide (TPR) repeat protein